MTLLLLGVGAVAAFAIALHFTDLPPDAPLPQSTILTDANGQRLATIGGQNRVDVPISQIPSVVTQAVVDTEDHDFFHHQGVDPKSVLRATWSDLRHKGNFQGGSTITQQYVKTVYLTQQRTFSRKLTEALMAIKLEQRYSKDEILDRYLNAIYFGRGAYGIQAASQAYFGKDVQQLGLPEASYLAGLIRAPELADAYSAPAVANERRTLTLDSMVRYGAITADQATAVKAKPLTSYVLPRSAQEPAIARTDKGTQYFVDYVRQMLVQRYGEAMVEGGGLQVKTSLDLDLQSKAYDSVYGFLKPNEPSGALVSLDENGNIKAMVAGRDWTQSKVNLAIGRGGGGDGRQAGSTFKPFALAAAIDDDIALSTTFPGPSKITIPHANNGADWVVSNFGNESFGRISLLDATVHSVNTVYAQLALQVGPQRIADVAKKAGVTSDLQPNPSLVLGTDNVSPLDMADAYLTFSQRGMHIGPVAIVEVRNADGQLLERAKSDKDRAVNQRTADTVNYVLQQVVQRGTGTGAQIGKPLAGKTGTTSNFGDAWFVGYTPHLATAVWMGYPDGNAHQMTDVRGVQVTGGTFPATIFANYMRAAVPAKQDDGFVLPAPLSTTTTSTSFVVTTPTTLPSVSSTTSVPSETTTTAPGAPGSSTTQPQSPGSRTTVASPASPPRFGDKRGNASGVTTTTQPAGLVPFNGAGVTSPTTSASDEPSP